MKSILFVATILYSSALFSQWNPVYYGNFNSRISMCVLNSDTVVNISLDNQINRFDGEDNVLTSFDELLFGGWLEDIDFPSTEVGYACGGSYFGIYRDVILKTYDSGMTWVTITTNEFTGYLFEHIEFLNVDTGFVAGDSPFVRTLDGGNSFEEIFLPTDAGQITLLSSTPDSRIIAATRQSVSNDPDSTMYSIYSSDDYGTNWDLRFSLTTELNSFLDSNEILDIYFLDNDLGYGVGNNGIFLKTTDGGDTWVASFISPFSNMSTVFFTSENVGYTNIAGGISKTIDGGETWSQQNVVDPHPIIQIEFANDSIGYAMSYERIYKTTNNGGTLSIDGQSELNGISVFPNPAQDFIQIATPNLVSIQKIDLYNSNGKHIYSFDKSIEKLNIGEVNSGIYFLTITSVNSTITKKIVID